MHSIWCQLSCLASLGHLLGQLVNLARLRRLARSGSAEAEGGRALDAGC